MVSDPSLGALDTTKVLTECVSISPTEFLAIEGDQCSADLTPYRRRNWPGLHQGAC